LDSPPYTSVNAVVREFLTSYAHPPARGAAIARFVAQATAHPPGSGPGGRRWTREDLPDRAGLAGRRPARPLSGWPWGHPHRQPSTVVCHRSQAHDGAWAGRQAWASSPGDPCAAPSTRRWVASAFDDEKVELLDGQIVYAAEEGPPHAAVCARLTRLLVERIPASEGTVRVGKPSALSDLSEPEPDSGRPARADPYRAAHPATASPVIEGAHTSRACDHGLKGACTPSAVSPTTGSSTWRVTSWSSTATRLGAAFRSVTRHRDGAVRALHHPAVEVDGRYFLR